MFTTEVPLEYSFASWASQQMLSTVAPFLILGCAGLSLSDMGLDSPTLEKFIDRMGIVLVALIAGGLAFLVQRAFPRSAIEGCWVWALPAGIFLLVFVSMGIRSGLVHALVDLFWPRWDPGTENGWGTIFSDLASAPAAYSVVMWRARHRVRGGPR
jgi:hypothetical protein